MLFRTGARPDRSRGPNSRAPKLNGTDVCPLVLYILTGQSCGEPTISRCIAPYSHKYRSLSVIEAAQLASACRTPREKRVVWTLLDTGARVSELAALTRGLVDISENVLFAGTRPIPPVTYAR